MPRGGRRPGAGAPKHNFNALKNGMYSDRMRRIGVILLGHPLFRLIYKRIRANLAKQILSTRPQKPATRGFIGVFVDGKCRCLYLAPKNKKNQSNFVFFIYTKNWGQEKSIIQPAKTTPFIKGGKEDSVPIPRTPSCVGKGQATP